jgi:hypothetical protein
MTYWYPKIKDLKLPVNQPKTVMIDTSHIDHLDWLNWTEKPVPQIEEVFDSIKFACIEMGYPVFIRTDHFSGKHSWRNTCYVEGNYKLRNNLMTLMDENFCVGLVGLPINAIVVREYVPMNTLFTAFWGKLPINPEIRLFIKDGELLCSHWYWIKDSIVHPSTQKWESILAKAQNNIKNIFSDELAKNIAASIGEVLDGYWSVDLCRAYDQSWYLIDMAEGSLSWHPTCKTTELIDQA